MKTKREVPSCFKSKKNKIFVKNPLAFLREEKKDDTISTGESLLEDEKSENFDKIEEKRIFAKISNFFDCKFVPSTILFRDKEMNMIEGFIQNCFENKEQNRNILISGKPGCGKTITVNKIINFLFQKNKSIIFITLNAMNFKNPFEIFNEIYYELTHSNEKVDIETLKDYISKFEKNIIIMIDEIDSLFLKPVANQDRILELFKLANLKNSKMMILGVSNSMELIFKIAGKYKVNLQSIKNVVFSSYTEEQLSNIIIERTNEFLKENKVRLLPEQIFEKNVIRLLCTKVYNVKGGDMRCIFDVLKKTFGKKLENETLTNEIKPISLKELMETFNETYSKSKTFEIIGNLPQTQQLTLVSIFLLKNESDQIKFNNLIGMYNKLSEDYFFSRIDAFGFIEILGNLQNYDLIAMDNNKDIKKRSLNLGEKIVVHKKITNDDIRYCLSNNELFSKYFI